MPIPARGDTTHSALSIANVAGITQANADAMAVAGYLIWPVTLGGAMMLFRGLPSAIQSMGQFMGGVVQHAGSHVVAESVFSAGMATWQTGTGSTISITPGGTEVMDNRGAVSNLGVSVQIADSIRSAISKQAQMNYTAVLNKSQMAGEQYSAGVRQIDDYGSHQNHSISSGKASSLTESTGSSKSVHEVSQLIETFRKEHGVSHERAAQVLGQVYADAKIGIGGSISFSGRSSSNSFYNEARQFSIDHHFSETVDSAKRAAVESHYRDSTDQGNRYAESIASSFDRGDTFRNEAASSYSKASSFASLASQSQENSSSVMGNYTQGLYEWMRTQASPYGGGTMSKSAIDNMAAHDPALLQSYANRYVEEKTNDIVNSLAAIMSDNNTKPDFIISATHKDEKE